MLKLEKSDTFWKPYTAWRFYSKSFSGPWCFDRKSAVLTWLADWLYIRAKEKAKAKARL